MTCRASAICGTALGLTNDVVSILRTPEREMASITWIFKSVGMNACSVWKPSRGPTSTMSTLSGRLIRLDVSTCLDGIKFPPRSRNLEAVSRV